MKRIFRHGFTLIELLVVIAIIAILASILFPVFARARAQARKTVCLSNMKQIGLGLMMYTQDFDETYPNGQWHTEYGGACASSYFGYGRIGGLLLPYTKNRGIFSCPEDTWVQFSTGISMGYNGAPWGPPSGCFVQTCYGEEIGPDGIKQVPLSTEVNGPTINFTDPDNGAMCNVPQLQGTSQATIVAPANNWAIGDLWPWIHEPKYAGGNLYVPDAWTGAPPRASNIVYADGHARFNNRNWLSEQGNNGFEGGFPW